MLRTIVLSVIASALTSFCVLFVGLTLVAPSRAQAENPIVVARAFEVVDDSGNVLAYLGGVSGDGSLVIYDHDGNGRVRVFGSGLYLNDEHGVVRGTWAMSSANHPLDGDTVFTLSDGEGNVLARLMEQPNGQPSLSFRTTTGELVRSAP